MKTWSLFLEVVGAIGLVWIALAFWPLWLAIAVCFAVSACIVVPLMLGLFGIDHILGEIGGHDTTSVRWKTMATVVVVAIALPLIVLLGQLWMPLGVFVLCATAFVLWAVLT